MSNRRGRFGMERSGWTLALRLPGSWAARTSEWNRRLLAVLSLAGLLLAARQGGAATLIYSTGFEASEGYSTNADLAGQQGWISFGSGGNGLVTGFFPGSGQQAYIGFTPPNTNDTSLSVWQPINVDPLRAGTPLVTFSVLMEVTDSSNTNWDDFYWSVYNSQSDRLFTIDFDNYYLAVNYALDGTNRFVSTGATFTNGVPYPLTITMDFSRGRWSATLGGTVLTTNLPMTTTNAPLNLGDVDAVWVPYDPVLPGDNLMVFDNYQITAQSGAPPPSRPTLQSFQRLADGSTLLRLYGQANARFAIDASTNLAAWTALKTNVATDGYFDYADTNAAGLRLRFYRGRWVP